MQSYNAKFKILRTFSFHFEFLTVIFNFEICIFNFPYVAVYPSSAIALIIASLVTFAESNSTSPFFFS